MIGDSRHCHRVWIGPLLTALLATLPACGPARPGRLTGPHIDPADVTTRLLARVDRDTDGLLTPAELAEVPGLAMAAKALDKDADGQLSASEIQAWFTEVNNARIAARSLSLSILKGQKPVRNARVRLVPEDFMGDDHRAAEGFTDAAGNVAPKIPGAGYPGVHCGVYRILIDSENDANTPPAHLSASPAGIAVGGQLPVESLVTIRLD